MSTQLMPLEIFIGMQTATIQGGLDDLGGARMFTCAYAPGASVDGRKPPNNSYYLLDSGAFTDKPTARLTPDKALDRQLEWEEIVQHRAFGFVSYDLLIDETWWNETKTKKRWSLSQADWAITETIQAAKYLASQRDRLADRKLLLSCQGVDAIQYTECAIEVLKFSTPVDWFGLGGWCIIGKQRSYLTEFFKTCYSVLPLVKQSGVNHVHIFGVTYLPALGGLLYLADQNGLTVSTDGTKPIKDCLWSTPEKRKQAGCRVASGDWHENVQWWKDTCYNLRQSKYYRKPPVMEHTRQLEMELI